MRILYFSFIIVNSLVFVFDNVCLEVPSEGHGLDDLIDLVTKEELVVVVGTLPELW